MDERQAPAAPDEAVIYHILEPEAWATAQAAGHISAPSLATEGFIHCSTAAQVAGSVARHYARADALVIVALDARALGTALRYEASRGGALFPHVFGLIPLAAVTRVHALRLAAPGVLGPFPPAPGE